MRIGFLGLGAMGARMAARLIDAGHEVAAWNRSADRPTPDGATRANSPAAAAQDADLVFAMVRDDGASHAVWLGPDGALAAMRPEAIGVDCSTLSLPHIETLATAFARAERRFIDAPLAGSRPQAESGQLIFLAGGATEAIETARPAFSVMGGALHSAGSNGAGALTKLMVNALFGAQIAVAAELIGLARRTGHDVQRALEILTSTPVASPAIQAAAPAMLGDAFPPAFPIALVEKDFRHLIASAAALDADTPLARATGAVFAAAAAEGYGADNITGVVQRY